MTTLLHLTVGSTLFARHTQISASMVSGALPNRTGLAVSQNGFLKNISGSWDAAIVDYHLANIRFGTLSAPTCHSGKLRLRMWADLQSSWVGSGSSFLAARKPSSLFG